jgi:hypothetical protein
MAAQMVRLPDAPADMGDHEIGTRTGFIGKARGPGVVSTSQSGTVSDAGAKYRH